MQQLQRTNDLEELLHIGSWIFLYEPIFKKINKKSVKKSFIHKTYSKYYSLQEMISSSEIQR